MTRLSSPALADPSEVTTTDMASTGLAPAAQDQPADPSAERARLVRLCARLTGDLDAAEDLAHEALLVAYRRADRLGSYGPHARWPWLAATARNLCLHWRRDRARALRRTAYGYNYWYHTGQSAPGDATAAIAADPTDPLDGIPSDLDLSVELERSELATLLDRAMALLPPDTRRVLVERYLEDSPQAQTALRLGLTEGAVAMRLQRGRLALRRILSTDLREDAAAYGLISPERDDWQPTRIWCSFCGTRRLWGRFGAAGYLHIVCRGCFGRREFCMVEGRFESLLDGIRGFGPAHNRVLRRYHEEFRHGIGGRLVRCPRCGTGAPLEVSPASGAAFREVRRACPHCGPVSGPGSVAGLATSTPPGRAFWREHARVRTLPEHEISYGGVPALLSVLESVTGSARLEVVFARDTLEMLAVAGAPHNTRPARSVA